MTLPENTYEVAAREVLEKHFPSHPPLLVELLSKVLGSVLSASIRGRIGRTHEQSVRSAANQLEQLHGSLNASLKAISSLSNLGKEILSRAMIGLLDGDDMNLGAYYYPDVRMGYVHKVAEAECQIKSLRNQAALALNVARAAEKKRGRGRPTKDDALSIAQHCALAFQALGENPSKPSWDPYESESYGKFYFFLKDMFAAGSVEANPEEYSKQAVEFLKKIK
ncbi:hypothetical protein [Ruegeria sp. HKCCE4150]|uniref:hypothetical protein n=1 Tax=Ruegeria sp. HKCCE4150 TaxID=2794828 RepID=UPI001AE4C687|nr:hypothetical protein [Ruegeria sp. HKCCE4150]